MHLVFELIGSLGVARALALSLALPGTQLPVSWGSDGRWIGYTVVAPRDEVPPPSAWILGPIPSAPPPAQIEKSTRDASPGRDPIVYRIWATQGAAPHASVMLEESDGPLGSPAWRPDGRALAYTRFIPSSRNGGRFLGRFEVILREGLDKRKVLHAEDDVAINEADIAGFCGAVPSWNRDGSVVAVPRFGDARSVLVLDVRSSKIIRTIDNASMPIWSPNGSRLAFVRGNPANDGHVSLMILDTPYSATISKVRALINDRAILQPPMWGNDGQSILAVSLKSRGSEENPSRPPVIRLVRVSTINGERLREWPLGLDTTGPRNAAIQNGLPKPGNSPPLAAGAGAQSPGTTSCVVDFDPDTEECFYTMGQAGLASTVVCQNLRDDVTHKRFPALDLSTDIANLSISPDGRTLAIRFRVKDTPGGISSPALCDVTTETLTVPAADESIRLDWLSHLLRITDGLLGKVLNPAAVPGAGIAERPLSLPTPGELTPAHPLAGRIRRLSRVGRTVCERAPDEASEARDSATRSFQAQASLYFDYLSGNLKDAEASLDQLDEDALSPRQRTALLGLRAQILMAKGDFTGSTAIIDYLDRMEPEKTLTVEETPVGPLIEQAPNQRRLWSKFLAHRQEDLKKSHVQQERVPALDDSGNIPPRPGDLLEEPMRGDGPIKLPFLPFDPDPRLFIDPPLKDRP